MMIIIKSEILLMITTILKMMVFTVSHACMRVKHDDEKDGFKMIDLIFAGKGRMRGLGGACHTEVTAWNL